MSLRRLISVVERGGRRNGRCGARPAQEGRLRPRRRQQPAPPAAGSARQPARSGSRGRSRSRTRRRPTWKARDENPDAPRGTERAEPSAAGRRSSSRSRPAIRSKKRCARSRCPQNMSEVSIAPALRRSQPVHRAPTRCARATASPRQVQLGLTYVFARHLRRPGRRPDEEVRRSTPARPVGLDVTVLLQNWLGVRVGVPVYLDPFAMSLALGAPMKFQFGDKFAIGGLDDVLNITRRAVRAELLPGGCPTPTPPERHHRQPSSRAARLRFSGYGIYQHKPNLALIGRLGVDERSRRRRRRRGRHLEPRRRRHTFIRAGVQFTPKKFVDLGALARLRRPVDGRLVRIGRLSRTPNLISRVEEIGRFCVAATDLAGRSV